MIRSSLKHYFHTTSTSTATMSRRHCYYYLTCQSTNAKSGYVLHFIFKRATFYFHRMVSCIWAGICSILLFGEQYLMSKSSPLYSRSTRLFGGSAQFCLKYFYRRPGTIHRRDWLPKTWINDIWKYFTPIALEGKSFTISIARFLIII